MMDGFIPSCHMHLLRIPSCLRDAEAQATKRQNDYKWGNGVTQTWVQRIPFFFFNKFIYLFIFGCIGSSFLCEGFL